MHSKLICQVLYYNKQQHEYTFEEPRVVWILLHIGGHLWLIPIYTYSLQEYV